jgi:hypothetical protein
MTEAITIADLFLYNSVASGDMSMFCEVQFVKRSDSQFCLRGIAECFNERRLFFSRLFSASFLPAIADAILLSFSLESSGRFRLSNIGNDDHVNHFHRRDFARHSTTIIESFAKQK